jgi:hypothetical protein
LDKPPAAVGRDWRRYVGRAHSQRHPTNGGHRFNQDFLSLGNSFHDEPAVAKKHRGGKTFNAVAPDTCAVSIAAAISLPFAMR